MIPVVLQWSLMFSVHICINNRVMTEMDAVFLFHVPSPPPRSPVRRVHREEQIGGADKWRVSLSTRGLLDLMHSQSDSPDGS